MKQVYLVLTEKCNLKCKHCIRGNKKFVDMKFNDAKMVMDLLNIKYPETTLVLTGGEPTLHEDFEKIFMYATSLFKNVIITSNGTTKFYQSIRKFKDVKNVIFQISIDGDRESHDAIRGIGNFNISLKTVEKLIENKMKVVVATTVNETNYLSLKNLYEMLIKLNVKRWYVNNELPFGTASIGKTKPLNTSLWNKLVKVMKKNCVKIKLNIKELFNIESLQKIENYNELDITKIISNCGTGKEKIYIYPDLNVYGCTCLKKYPFGNFKETRIDDIMNSSNAKLITNYTVKKDSICYTCKYIDICNGGCIGMSLYKFGKIGYGDIRCPIVNKGDSLIEKY